MDIMQQRRVPVADIGKAIPVIIVQATIGSHDAEN
jgi:hypothetical protein